MNARILWDVLALTVAALHDVPEPPATEPSELAKRRRVKLTGATEVRPQTGFTPSTEPVRPSAPHPCASSTTQDFMGLHREPTYHVQLHAWTALARWPAFAFDPAWDTTLLRPALVLAAAALDPRSPDRGRIEAAGATYAFVRTVVLHRPGSAAWLAGTSLGPALSSPLSRSVPLTLCPLSLSVCAIPCLRNPSQPPTGRSSGGWPTRARPAVGHMRTPPLCWRWPCSWQARSRSPPSPATPLLISARSVARACACARCVSCTTPG